LKSTLLSNNQRNSIQLEIHSLIVESINDTKNELDKVGKTYMRKNELCEYLSVANNTLDKFIQAGLPQIRVRGIIRYNKTDVDDFMRNHKIY